MGQWVRLEGLLGVALRSPRIWALAIVCIGEPAFDWEASPLIRDKILR